MRFTSRFNGSLCRKRITCTRRCKATYQHTPGQPLISTTAGRWRVNCCTRKPLFGAALCAMLNISPPYTNIRGSTVLFAWKSQNLSLGDKPVSVYKPIPAVLDRFLLHLDCVLKEKASRSASLMRLTRRDCALGPVPPLASPKRLPVL